MKQHKLKIYILLVFILVGLCASQSFAQTQAIVISNQAQFREKPSKTAKVIFTVKKGTKFKLESVTNKNGWYYVSVLNGNQKGWIHGNDIKLSGVVAEKTLQTKDDWQLVTYSDVANYYLSPSRVNLKDGIVDFWIKVVALDKKAYLDQMFKTLFNKPFPPEMSADNYLHSLEKYLGNCKTSRLSRIKEVSYWKDGSTGGYDVSDRTVTLYEVVPNSIGEAMLLKACSIK